MNATIPSIARTASDLLLSDDPASLVQDIYERLAEELSLEVYFHYRWDPTAERLRLRCASEIEPSTRRELATLRLGEGVCGVVAEQREPRVISDVQARRDAVTAFIRRLGLSAYACFPLVSGDRLIGTLSFGSRERTRFDEADVDLLGAVATHLAVALDRQRLLAELAESNARLRAEADERRRIADNQLALLTAAQLALERQNALSTRLHHVLRVADVALTALSTSAQLLELLRRVREGIAADAATLFVLRGDTLEPRASQGVLNVAEGLIGDGIAGAAAALGGAVTVDQSCSDPALRASLDRLGLRSAIAVPLRAEGRVVGVLAVGDRKRDRFEAEQVELLELVADRAATALLRDQLHEAESEARRNEAEARRRVEEMHRAHLGMQHDIERARRLESLGTLAGGVAHDFNNLLTGIVGNLSLARSLAGDGAVADRLTRAEVACDKARMVARQLLTFAKGGEPVKVPVELRSLVEEHLRYALGGSVQSEVCVPHGLVVDADPAQLGQVVHDLALNAHAAMPRGGLLRVSAHAVHFDASPAPGLEPGPYARLRFEDEGRGIPPELLQHVFDPYFATTTDGGGLGLATSYSVVRRHGGHMRCESAPGEGATFEILLPVSTEPPVVARVVDELPDDAEPLRARVLVMDDDPIVLELARAALTRAGCRVSAARHGEEALSYHAQGLADGQPFDLVVLDVTIIGGLGGEATIERLRAVDPHVRAIVSSGYSDAPVLADHRAFGFDGVLPKPYRIEELVGLVRELLDGDRPDGHRTFAEAPEASRTGPEAS